MICKKTEDKADVALPTQGDLVPSSSRDSSWESALQLLLLFMVVYQPLCSFMLNQACRGLCLSISSIRHRLLPTMMKAFGNALTQGGTHAMSVHGR